MTEGLDRCPECGAEPDPASDFCPSCGAYVAWDDLREEAHETAPTLTLPRPAPPAPAPPAASGRLAVWVGDAKVGDPDAFAALRTAAGSPLTLTATVRNASGIVDTFTVAVEGLPENWVEVRPPTANLLPVGPRGHSEQRVAITISPPHSSAAPAGAWPFTVTLRSYSRGTEDARVAAQLTIEPFVVLDVQVRPKVVTGRRRASFACEVHNTGNSETNVHVVARAPDQACAFDLPAARRVGGGEVTPMPVRVRAARPLWVGRPANHPVEIEALSPDLPAPVKATPVVYRQRPWVPWWVPPLLILVAMAALALYLALPRKVTMPAVVGARNAFAAQQQLARAGVRSHPQVKVKVLPRLAAGTVVGQVPPAGSRVPPTTPVTFEVAATPATTIVPDLTGLKPATADSVLARVRLTLGAVSPALDPEARIQSQLPAAGAQRKQGTPVGVVLAPRKVKVPDLRGLTPPAAEKLLNRLGLELGSVNPKVRNHARIASQVPAPKVARRRGTAVDVVVARLRMNVPNLVGMGVQAAEKALTVCELELGPLPQDIAAGQWVAAQVPARGARRPPGTLVTVILAPKGKRKPKSPPPPTKKECRAK